MVGLGGSSATIVPGSTDQVTGSRSPSQTIVPGSSDPSQTLLPGEQVAPPTPESHATIGATPHSPALEETESQSNRAEPTSTEEFPDEPVPQLEDAIRPEVAKHVPGADLKNVNPAEMVAVSDVLQPPRVPYLAGALALLCLAAAAFIGWTGLSGPDTELAQIKGATILGQRIGDQDLVELALDEPLVVSGLGDGDTARLSFSAFGFDHVRTDSGPIVDGIAEIEPGAARWVVSGSSDATLEVLADDRVVAAHELEILATNPVYTSATGIAAALAALFTFGAYESNLRPLRRGRRKLSSFLGLAIFGAIGGVLVVVAAALFAEIVVQIPTAIAAAALGAAGSVALGTMVLQWAQRRRISRRNARNA
jgi:hypothetical protein